MVRAAGHLGIGVLHLGRRTGVHRAGMRLVLGDELPQPVEGALHHRHVGLDGQRLPGGFTRLPRCGHIAVSQRGKRQHDVTKTREVIADIDCGILQLEGSRSRR